MSLWEHWTTAEEDDSNFVVKEGFLHHRSADSLGETILQIVIPTDLRRRVFNLIFNINIFFCGKGTCNLRPFMGAIRAMIKFSVVS